MSLRSKIEGQKSQEEATKTREQAGQSSEQIESEREEKLNTLTSWAEDLHLLSELHQQLEDNLSIRRKGKNDLRNSRQELRDIHQQSQELESEDNRLPKPTELIKDEEYQDEEEIKNYNQIRESLKGALEGKNDLHSQIVESLGEKIETTHSSEEMLEQLQQLRNTILDSVKKFEEENPGFIAQEVANHDNYEQVLNTSIAQAERNINSFPANALTPEMHKEELNKIESFRDLFKTYSFEASSLLKIISRAKNGNLPNFYQETYTDGTVVEAAKKAHDDTYEQIKNLETQINKKKTENLGIDLFGGKKKKQAAELSALEEQLSSARAEKDQRYEVYLRVHNKRSEREGKFLEAFSAARMGRIIEDLLKSRNGLPLSKNDLERAIDQEINERQAALNETYVKLNQKIQSENQKVLDEEQREEIRRKSTLLRSLPIESR